MAPQSRALLLLLSCISGCFSPEEPESATTDRDTDATGASTTEGSAVSSGSGGDPSTPSTSTTDQTTLDPDEGSTSDGGSSNTDGKGSSSGDHASASSGYDDVMTVGSGSSIGVALSNAGGSGVLTSTTVGQVGGNALRNGVVLVDLDGNADLDFAFTDILNGGQVIACRGDGTGIASSCDSFPAGGLPVGLAAGDIDGDGSADLVTADSLSNTVTILLGQGNGAFEDGIPLPTGDGPQQVALADLNADGFDDVVVTHVGDATVRLFLFAPDLGVMEPSLVFDVEAGTPTDIVTADFNHDGAIDIAIGNATESTVGLLLSGA